ncbi:MAG: DUF3747 domain-containing protein [Synechococcaceae cyanobacterium]|nr:DUF3747 domain-containing protein [Synechococcaceae cyanobacterium]
MVLPIPLQRLLPAACRWTPSALAACLLAGTAVPSARASSLFAAAEVELQRFVLVAAPIGSGPRAQLNIYEQVSAKRPCFAVGEGRPAAVNPLLATFDFTGVCSRYIDGNGYSLRIGGQDLGTSYRLMVSRDTNDVLLLAIPTRPGAGPELVVARTGGAGSGFLKFDLEPGWTLKRRQFGGRRLGHIYVYRPSWPGPVAEEASPGDAAPPVALPVTP